MSGLFSLVMERSIAMEATPWSIWKVLCALDAYGTWNPIYPEAAGQLRPGADVHVSMRFLRDTPGPLTMRVQSVVHSKELVWTCSYAFPGFLDIMHCFIIAPVDRYGSRFMHGIRVSGVLLPLFAGKLRAVTEANVERMTTSLKATVEARR